MPKTKVSEVARLENLNALGKGSATVHVQLSSN